MEISQLRSEAGCCQEGQGMWDRCCWALLPVSLSSCPLERLAGCISSPKPLIPQSNSGGARHMRLHHLHGQGREGRRGIPSLRDRLYAGSNQIWSRFAVGQPKGTPRGRAVGCARQWREREPPEVLAHGLGFKRCCCLQANHRRLKVVITVTNSSIAVMPSPQASLQ